MIRIRKPPKPPKILQTKGATLTKAQCRHRAAGGTHGLRPKFRQDVYAHGEVKQALSVAQHGKCCFCESKILHISYGDVEHFRPKGAVRQARALTLERTGYYWLAYEWSNLYLSCTLCNQRHKQNLFPLEDPDSRVRSHTNAQSLEGERPMFIDPGAEDPEHQITYHRAIAAPVNSSTRGEITIAALGLNRADLVCSRREKRKSRLLILEFVVGYLRSEDPNLEPFAAKGLAYLHEAVQDDAEYAAMFRALLRDAHFETGFGGTIKPTLATLRLRAQTGTIPRVPPG